MCEYPEILLIYFLNPAKLPASCQLQLSWLAVAETFSLSYFLYFFATLILEGPIYWIFLRPAKWWKPFLLGNLLTHPLVFFFFPWMASKLDWTHAVDLGVSQIFAWVVEGIVVGVFLKGNFKKGFLVSFIANLFSWRFGAWFLSTFLGSN